MLLWPRTSAHGTHIPSPGRGNTRHLVGGFSFFGGGELFVFSEKKLFFLGCLFLVGTKLPDCAKVVERSKCLRMDRESTMVWCATMAKSWFGWLTILSMRFDDDSLCCGS